MDRVTVAIVIYRNILIIYNKRKVAATWNGWWEIFAYGEKVSSDEIVDEESMVSLLDDSVIIVTYPVNYLSHDEEEHDNPESSNYLNIGKWQDINKRRNHNEDDSHNNTSEMYNKRHRTGNKERTVRLLLTHQNQQHINKKPSKTLYNTINCQETQYESVEHLSKCNGISTQKAGP